jgi:hypothetical protein
MSIAHTAPLEPAGDMRLSYLASAASPTVQSHGLPPLHPPEALARSNSAVNDFQRRCALIPKIPRVYDPINTRYKNPSQVAM